MPLEQLTTPPVSPSPTDGPNFAARAFAFLNWWYTVHGPELNEWVTAFNNQVSVLDSHVTSAETFANAASASASTATTQAGIATTKAADAAAQVVLAAAQVTLATNQVTLATTQAGNAATKAVEAATSATNASNSATASANSATASATSKTGADTAAGTATTQAGIATTKAGEAATSKTGADTAAATATTQAGIATTKAGEAATSKTGADTAAATATTKASEAATSKTGADTAATTATTQAGISTTQAGIATTQAGIASTKADEAADSAATVIAAISAVPTFLTMGIPPIDTMPTFQWRPGREDVPYNVTATRASTATRTNEVGLIEQVANNVVRIDHDPITGECLGALCEEARTNLLTYSENFDNAAWIKSGVSIAPNSATAPDGTMAADKVVESSGLSYKNIIRSISSPASSVHSATIFAKAGEKGKLRFFLDDGGGSNRVRADFDLFTGTVSGISNWGTGSAASASIVLQANGQYRLILSGIPASTGSTIRFVIELCDNSWQFNYTGDGVSGLYIWGAQLEAGAFPTSYIPSSVSFTSRASTATYVGSDGLIKSAAIDTARMNYNPTNLSVAPKLLVEAASTNLLTYSEDFSNAAWVKYDATVASNSVVSPDGGTTADKLVEGTGSVAHSVRSNATSTIGAAYTKSVYAKIGERSQIALELFGSSTIYKAIFSLYTGTFVSSAGTGSYSIASVGGGWYRISITATATTTTTYSFILTSSSGTTGYLGDGTSGLYIWGAQLESGTLSSYIPTTTAAVTRAADVSSSAAATRAADVWTVPVSSFAFNASEGTVYTSSRIPNTSNKQQDIFALNDGIGQNSVTFRNWASSSLVGGLVASNNTNVWISPSSSLTDRTSTLRTIIAYQSASFAESINGANAQSQMSGAIPNNISQLSIGSSFGILQLCGHIRHIAYFPRRISDSNLQLITA